MSRGRHWLIACSSIAALHGTGCRASPPAVSESRSTATAPEVAAASSPPAAPRPAEMASSPTSAAPASAPPASAASVARPVTEAPSAAQRFVVNGHELSVTPAPGPCTVSHRAPGGVAGTIALGLSGPCYIMPWAKPPPQGRLPGSVSDAVPVGVQGEARAYSYGNGATVVLVIGNPVAPEQAERARGYTCAGGTQGIVLQGARAQASRRIVERASRPECLEWGGPDEQEYWLFGHD